MTLLAPRRRSRRREVHEYVLGRYDRYGPDGSLRFEDVDGEYIAPGTSVRLAQAERTLTAWRDGLVQRHHTRRNRRSIAIRVVCCLILAVGIAALFAACGSSSEAVPSESIPSGAESGSHEAAPAQPAPAVAIADSTPAPAPARDPDRTAGETPVAGDAPPAPASLLAADPDTAPAAEEFGPATAVLAAAQLEAPASPAPAAEATPAATPAPQPAQPAATPTPTPIPDPQPATQPVSTPQPESTAATIQQAAPQPAAAPAVALSAYEDALLAGLNAERTRHGLAPFNLSASITEVARHRSSDMSANGYFAHQSPSGETWISLLSAAGIRITTGGENLARVSGDAQRASSVAVEKLMESPTHRDNILNARYSRIGVGAATDAAGVTVFTTIFTD